MTGIAFWGSNNGEKQGGFCLNACTANMYYPYIETYVKVKGGYAQFNI